jgi:hypothetical protein
VTRGNLWFVQMEASNCFHCNFGILKHIVLGRGRRAIGTLLVENDGFFFDIPQIYFVALDFISIKHGILL